MNLPFIVKHFSTFCNIFFYIQPTFVFHILEGFYINHDHIDNMIISAKLNWFINQAILYQRSLHQIYKSSLNVFAYLSFFGNLFAFFQKQLRIKFFICFKNRIDQCYWQINTMRTFFWHSIIMNICIDFTFIRFYFSCLIFFITPWFIMKSVFNTKTDFIPVVSSKRLVYSLIFGSIILNDPTFLSSL